MSDKKKAVLHRMVLPNYTCSYGTAAHRLLTEQGFEVEEHILETRAQTDAFKAKHGVTTTPLIFIDGEKIGGFTDLRRHLGQMPSLRITPTAVFATVIVASIGWRYFVS